MIFLPILAINCFFRLFRNNLNRPTINQSFSTEWQYSLELCNNNKAILVGSIDCTELVCKLRQFSREPLYLKERLRNSLTHVDTFIYLCVQSQTIIFSLWLFTTILSSYWICCWGWQNIIDLWLNSLGVLLDIWSKWRMWLFFWYF